METLLKTCIEEYLQHLADIGKKPSTIGTSKRARDLLLVALVWWTEKGYLDSVPLPKDEKRFLKTEKKDGGNDVN